MPNNNKIRWRDKDIEVLKKTINNFNRRVTRASKKSPDYSYLPAKLNFKNEMNKIATRRDFNNLIKSLNRFNSKTAIPVKNDMGTTTTKWQLIETKLKLRNINKERNKTRSNINPYIGLDNTADSNNLKERKLNFNKKNQSDWEQFVERINKQDSDYFKQERMNTYKDNYISAFSELIGDEDIIKRLKTIPPTLLLQWIYEEPILSIDFIYDPLEAQIKSEQISKHLAEKGY